MCLPSERTDSSKSLWRPLFGPLRDWPLGLCDFRSLNLANDLLSSDNILPHKVTETYNVVYNERHEWYYLKDQMPDEILVFKSFDSKEGVATGIVTAPPYIPGLERFANWLFSMSARGI